MPQGQAGRQPEEANGRIESTNELMAIARLHIPRQSTRRGRSRETSAERGVMALPERELIWEREFVSCKALREEDARMTGRRLNRRQVIAGTAATDRKSTRLNSSHIQKSRMPSSA